ncbi:MAG: replicative DNA helicase [Erysipelotrichaceae bacterium]|nr:replicative DNA helicase [Erysipelotrichaceae bacterium]
MSKTLPNAIDAEQSLLGTIMVYPNAARISIESGMISDYFFLDSHQKIYNIVTDLYNEGKPIDITTVSTRLNDLNLLTLVGGLDYLMNLSDTAVSSYNTKTYVELIQNKAFMRNMIDACNIIIDSGMDGQTDIDDYLDTAEKLVLDVSRNRRATEFRSSSTLVGEVIETIKKRADNRSNVTGIKTGFTDLDNVTHGFQRGDLIILAARPAMGKTAVALNLMTKIAQYQNDQAVAIFSLEMPAEHLIQRMLASKSTVSGGKIATGSLSNTEWSKLSEAAQELKNTNIYIDDSPIIKVSEIFSKCRKLQTEKGLSAIMIDYIQLLSGSGSGSSKENRQQEVSEISRNLKALARELKVPVIALSQLSRGVESRSDKKPMISDLRESGSIEQDADIVMLLFREKYYKKEDGEIEGKEDPMEVQPLDVDIAKHRNGATKVIRFAFQPATSAIYTSDSESYRKED